MQEGCIQGQFCPLLEAGGCMDAFFWEKGHLSREVIPFVLVQVDLHIELLLWELYLCPHHTGLVEAVGLFGFYVPFLLY